MTLEEAKSLLERCLAEVRTNPVLLQWALPVCNHCASQLPASRSSPFSTLTQQSLSRVNLVSFDANNRDWKHNHSLPITTAKFHYLCFYPSRHRCLSQLTPFATTVTLPNRLHLTTSDARARTHAHIRARAHTHTHTHTRARALHIHIHTHTHTHTHIDTREPRTHGQTLQVRHRFMVQMPKFIVRVVDKDGIRRLDDMDQ
jgi:hypothetical protein